MIGLNFLCSPMLTSFYILNKSSSISLDYFLTRFILLLGKEDNAVIVRTVKTIFFHFCLRYESVLQSVHILIRRLGSGGEYYHFQCGDEINSSPNFPLQPAFHFSITRLINDIFRGNLGPIVDQGSNQGSTSLKSLLSS